MKYEKDQYKMICKKIRIDGKLVEIGFFLVDGELMLSSIITGEIPKDKIFEMLVDGFETYSKPVRIE